MARASSLGSDLNFFCASSMFFLRSTAFDCTQAPSLSPSAGHSAARFDSMIAVTSSMESAALSSEDLLHAAAARHAAHATTTNHRLVITHLLQERRQAIHESRLRQSSG